MRQDKQEGGEGEDEGMVWRRRNLARGRRDEQVSVRESPPFRQCGPLLVLPVFHEKQNQNQLLPKEMYMWMREKGQKKQGTTPPSLWSSAS